jgi:hypothetical protein
LAGEVFFSLSCGEWAVGSNEFDYNSIIVKELRIQGSSWAQWLMPIILANGEAETQRQQFKVSLCKKFLRPPSQPISWVWWHILVIPATWEA